MSSTAPTPTAVVFDLGKVLLDFDYGIVARRLAAHSGRDAEQIRGLLDQSPLLFRFESGGMTNDEFFREVSSLTDYTGAFDEFADIFGDIFAAIYPMIDLHTQLRARGVPPRADVPVGIMVETPAAAVLAGAMARDVSFFSIGTNDLVQYTLAVDRGNAALASRFTPLHPAVLRLIRMTREVADARGVAVSVCGEMASDPLMAFTLVGLGIRQLSVSPISLPRVKALIRGMRVAAAVEAARRA